MRLHKKNRPLRGTRETQLMKLFSIKDTKAGTFGSPISARSIPEAMRMLTQATRDEKSMLSQFPADYELWLIADFDELNADLTKPENSGFVCNIASVKEAAQNV